MSGTENLGDLQSILVGAMRCLDCRDQHCLNTCPEHVDVPAAMRLIVSRTPNSRNAAWVQRADDATHSAMDGVQTSFEL